MVHEPGQDMSTGTMTDGELERALTEVNTKISIADGAAVQRLEHQRRAIRDEQDERRKIRQGQS
jgi:hypothetical protein